MPIRPYIINSTAIVYQNNLGINISVAPQNSAQFLNKKVNLQEKSPMQNFQIFKTRNFILEMLLKDEFENVIFKFKFNTDRFGYSSFKVELPDHLKEKKYFIISFLEHGNLGITHFLGSIAPFFLDDPLKILICDFDKTLVDTSYKTISDVYSSLTMPTRNFPTVTEALSLFKQYIHQGYSPFILSASPHFYVKSINEWLQGKGIFPLGIFLKDYRQILSPFFGLLGLKDLTNQGVYKLTGLLEILLITGIPKKLVLMGDNFESDPLIYQIFAEVLNSDKTTEELLTKIKRIPTFSLTDAQYLALYDKISSIKSQKQDNVEIEVLIRKIHQNSNINYDEFDSAIFRYTYF